MPPEIDKLIAQINALPGISQAEKSQMLEIAQGIKKDVKITNFKYIQTRKLKLSITNLIKQISKDFHLSRTKVNQLEAILERVRLIPQIFEGNDTELSNSQVPKNSTDESLSQNTIPYSLTEFFKDVEILLGKNDEMSGLKRNQKY